MDQFLRDFSTVIKILKWREPSLERYDDPVFVNGFKHIPFAVQRQKAREILKSVNLVNLANTLKFIGGNSELAEMMVTIITSELSVITTALSNREKKVQCK